jgi:hypothetical protein
MAEDDYLFVAQAILGHPISRMLSERTREGDDEQ